VAKGEKTKVIRTDLERCARVYRTDKEASRALKVFTRTFVQLCRQYRIETPNDRERRKRVRWEQMDLFGIRSGFLREALMNR